MTQDQSAPFAHLDALKSADAGTVFAELIRAGLRALIEAESTARSRAAHPTAPTTENAQATILMDRRYAGRAAARMHEGQHRPMPGVQSKQVGF